MKNKIKINNITKLIETAAGSGPGNGRVSLRLFAFPSRCEARPAKDWRARTHHVPPRRRSLECKLRQLKADIRAATSANRESKNDRLAAKVECSFSALLRDLRREALLATVTSSSVSP